MSRIPHKDAASIWGGKICDYPEPHLRKFDDRRRKREVKVEILKFYGMGKHHYAILREENNPIWDEKEHAWRLCDDDRAGKGRRIEERFNTIEAANSFIKRTANKLFPASRYILIRNLAYIPRQKWTYKDGD